MMRLGLLLAALACLAAADTFAGVIHKSHTPFVYLGKYAFGFDKQGSVVGFVNFTVVTETEKLAVYLFDDEPDSWPAVQAAGYDCNAAVVNAPSKYRAVARVPAVEQTYYWNENVVEVTHPRYWFVAIAPYDCSTVVEETTFTLEFQQADGTLLSNDEEALPGIRLTFFLLWVLLAGTAMFFARPTEGEWRPMQLRWLVWPASLEVLAQALLTVHWYAKAGDGIGVAPAEALGRASHEVGLLLLWGVLVASAGGAGVTRRTLLTAGDRASLVGLLAVMGVGVLEIVLVLWYSVGRDPSSNDYVFDTGIGVAIVVLQALVGVWFLVSVRWTHQSASPTVRPWLPRFALAGAPSFIVLLLVAVVAAAVPAYDRLSAVEATFSCTYALAYVAVLVVFLPHIGAAELEDLYRAGDLLHGAVDELMLGGEGQEADAALSALPSGTDADKVLDGTI